MPGIRVVQTAVGDRYVLEAMNARGLPLGGEQSGHVVMLEHATTGDGSLTALHLLARVAETGKPLGELAAVMQRLPQVLVNVPDVDKVQGRREPAPSRRPSPRRRPSSAGTGRVLLRPSGTEPLVRVMVEAPTHGAGPRGRRATRRGRARRRLSDAGRPATGPYPRGHVRNRRVRR